MQPNMVAQAAQYRSARNLSIVAHALVCLAPATEPTLFKVRHNILVLALRWRTQPNIVVHTTYYDSTGNHIYQCMQPIV